MVKKSAAFCRRFLVFPNPVGHSDCPGDDDVPFVWHCRKLFFLVKRLIQLNFYTFKHQKNGR